MALNILYCIFFLDLQPAEAEGIVRTLFIQYYSTICRPSEHTAWGGGPGARFEPGTGDLEAGTLTSRPPHLLCGWCGGLLKEVCTVHTYIA